MPGAPYPSHRSDLRVGDARDFAHAVNEKVSQKTMPTRGYQRSVTSIPKDEMNDAAFADGRSTTGSLLARYTRRVRYHCYPRQAASASRGAPAATARSARPRARPDLR